MKKIKVNLYTVNVIKKEINSLKTITIIPPANHQPVPDDYTNQNTIVHFRERADGRGKVESINHNNRVRA